MFKYNSDENEIYRLMEKKLASNQLENKYSFEKISKATDYLNIAASIFDKAGMYTESEEVSEILHSLTKQLNNKTPNK